MTFTNHGFRKTSCVRIHFLIGNTGRGPWRLVTHLYQRLDCTIGYGCGYKWYRRLSKLSSFGISSRNGSLNYMTNKENLTQTVIRKLRFLYFNECPRARLHSWHHFSFALMYVEFSNSTDCTLYHFYATLSPTIST